MLTLLAVFMDGIVYASWLFTISLGLTLIYGVMKILNIAHGSLYALGAYAAAWMTGIYFAGGYPPYASYAMLVASALVVGLLAGTLIERGILRWMYGHDEVLMVLVTYAIFLILEDVIKLIWGVDAYFPYQPYSLLGNVMIGGIPFMVYNLAFVGVAVLTGLFVWWGINRTRFGKMLLAVIHDREVSLAMGINVTAIFTATFVFGSVLGAVGGALTAPTTSVTTGLGVEVIILAFAVAVIGGLGSIEGAALGAVIVGFCRAAAVHLFPEAELFVIYGVMSLVLSFRHEGLFVRSAPRQI